MPPEIARFLLPLDSLRHRSLRQAPFLHFHLSSFIGLTPESFLKGFSLRFSVLQKVSRLCHLKSRDSCCLSISLRPRGPRQAPYLHFHQSPARKSPERLFSPIQRTPESFLTTPPEISRFPFGTKVIKILDLSPYLPPTRPFAVSPTLSYSPTPVLHQPRHQTESAPLVHQSPCTFYPHLTLSYNNTHQSSSSLPIITKFAFPTGPSALLSFLFPKASPSPTPPPDRIRSSRSSISLHVLSSSHPVLQQHSSVHSSLPTITKFTFPTVPCTVLLQSGNLELARMELHGI